MAEIGQTVEAFVLNQFMWWASLLVGRVRPGVGLWMPVAVALSVGLWWRKGTSRARDLTRLAAHWVGAVTLYVCGVLNASFVAAVGAIALAVCPIQVNTRLKLAVGIGLGGGIGLFRGSAIGLVLAGAVCGYRARRPGLESVLVVLCLLDSMLSLGLVEPPGKPRVGPGVMVEYGVPDAYHVEVGPDFTVFTSKASADGRGTRGVLFSTPSLRAEASPNTQVPAARVLRFRVHEGRVLGLNDTIDQPVGDLAVLDLKSGTAMEMHCAVPEGGECRFNARYMALDVASNSLLTTAQHPEQTVVKRRLDDLGLENVRPVPLQYAGPVAVNGSRGRAWVLDLSHNHAGILEMELNDLEVRRFKPVAVMARNLIQHRHSLFVARTAHGDVAEYHQDSLELVRLLPATPHVRELVAHGARLYAAGYFSGRVAVVDLDTGERLGVFRTGVFTRGLTWSKGRLYAANWHGIVSADVRQALSAEEDDLTGLSALEAIPSLGLDLVYGYTRLLGDFPGIGTDSRIPSATSQPPSSRLRDASVTDP